MLKLLRIIQKYARRFGIEIVSIKKIKNIERTVSALLDLVVDGQDSGQPSSIQIIIFSKDRPLQLDGLLESIDKYEVYGENISYDILYHCSSKKYDHAYKKLLSRYTKNKIVFHSEKLFKQDLIEIINNSSASKVMFLCDDDLFVEKIDFDSLLPLNCKELVPSLRLGENISYSFAANSKQDTPIFEIINSINNDEFICWPWIEYGYEWGYPLSVNGHIFNKNEIQIMANVIEYNGPNSFESGIQYFNSSFKKRRGICFRNPKIINIPFNLVQNEAKNRKLNYSAEHLLGCFNNGYEMDIDKYSTIYNNSVHLSAELYLIKKNK